MMRTTRAVAKAFCTELEHGLPSNIARSKPSTAVRYANARRVRTKKMVNNPWGNKGRKKCAACRTRKRNCMFEDEGSPCEFCTAHGARCGPKVFAEKARYFHAKVDGTARYVHADADAFPSQRCLFTTVKSDETISYESRLLDTGPFHSLNGRNPLALNLDGLDVPVKSELPADSFNLSTPSTASFSSIQSRDGYAFPADFQSGSDAEPSYTAAPLPLSLVPEQELLPLYTEPCDDEIFEMSGLNGRFDTPPPTQHGYEQRPSLATYMCIRRFA